MALVVYSDFHIFPIKTVSFEPGLAHVDCLSRAVSLVLRWLALQRLYALWCCAGYHFIDDERSRNAWRSSSALICTFFQFKLRFAGCAVVAIEAPVLHWLPSQ